MSGVNHEVRAFRAWPILINCAQQHRQITYGELAKKLKIHHHAVGHVLGVIQNYCLDEHLPPLTILVVSQSKRRPGHGFIAWDVDDLKTGRKKVYGFNWQIVENPFSYAKNGSTVDRTVNELILKPEKARDVYARVKVRGTAQVIFRKVLLRIYGGKCAFCGLTFEDALEASHIIPWVDALPEQRLDPCNGILLCSIHHRLFDAGLMTISESGKIRYYDPKGKDGNYAASDKVMTLDLHGKSARLPKRQKYQPSINSLTWHHRYHDFGKLS